MKKISYLCSTYLISCATLAHANIFSPDTHLSVYTKSTTSVAESSDFIKLAAVYPLSGNGGMTFKAPKATSCAAGYESYNGKCIKKCDRKTYPFASQPSTVKGTFSSCTGLTTYYGYTACNNGWSLSNHDCIENTCDGYVPQADLSHCQTAGGNICYRGSTAVYKCSTCDAGWVLNASGICVEKSCSSDDYPYPSNPGEDAGKVKSCQSGERTWYGYESCNSGWVKSGSYCNKATCDTTAYPYTTQGQAAGCKTTQECKAGSDSYYGCGTSGCKSGYIADGNQCVACSWDDNALASCPEHGVCTPQTCGGITKYKMTGCDSGYNRSGNTCVLACSLDGYDLASCPEHGVCTSKTCGGTTKYTLNSCEGEESTQLTCNVGDIYYADDTCSENKINSKMPIGVVYDAVNRLVVSLDYVSKTWGGSGVNVPQIANSETDMNGKSNTNILVSLGGYPAAQYCHDMTTGGKEWYLPAYGEMQAMNTNFGAIEGGFATLGSGFYTYCYWSSTEADYYGYNALFLPVYIDSCGNRYGKDGENYLRCVFSYAEGTTTTYVKQGNTCVLACSLDGYDLTSCPEHGVCSSKTCGSTTKYKLDSCESTQLTCNVGDIYYADDTCSPDVISGKTPIGVVYDTEHKLVVGLDEKSMLLWGEYGSNPLPNYGDVVSAKTDMNGKSNTDTLVSLGTEYQVANYCHDKTTGGKTWYLPAFGEMQPMYNSAVISKLGVVGTAIGGYGYWSSTDSGYSNAWFFAPVDGVSGLGNKGNPYFVRCVFSYEEGTTTTYVKLGNTCVIGG